MGKFGFGGMMPASDAMKKGTYEWDYSKNRYVHKPFDSAAYQRKQQQALRDASRRMFRGPDGGA
jgi:hypothetical protein